MSVAAGVSALPFKSHEGVRDEERDEDDIPAFLRRPASAQPQAPRHLSRKTSPSLVLLLFASGYCLAYVYRTLPALISEPLIKELGLTPGDLGILSAAFFFATAALQLPIGVWLDRYGPRRVQGLLMFSAVIGAALFALTDNVVLLTIARALIGIGAAGGFMAGLKAIGLWFPPERVALANSWLVMLGSLGACLATWPAAWVMAEMGWRGLFEVLAALTAVSALAILMLVPERHPKRNDARQAPGVSILSIYRDGRFWRLAPLSALSVGSAWALQGLWAAPWFSTVEALDRQTIVIYLFVMAAILAPSALLLGVTVHQLRRRGISPGGVFGFVTALGMSAEFALILRLPLPPLLPWLVIAGIGTVTVLSFTILSQMFSASGRANAALNLLHLGTAFLVQSGIGFLIEQWTPIDGQFAGDRIPIGICRRACRSIRRLERLRLAQTHEGRRSSPCASASRTCPPAGARGWSDHALPYSSAALDGSPPRGQTPMRSLASSRAGFARRHRQPCSMDDLGGDARNDRPVCRQGRRTARARRNLAHRTKRVPDRDHTATASRQSARGTDR